LLVPRCFEGFALIADYSAELLNILSLDGNFWSHKLVANVDRRKDFVVAVPEFPVELLDALVAINSDLMNWSKSLGRSILELKSKRNRGASALFEHCNSDGLGLLRIHNFNSLKVRNVLAIRAGGTIEANGHRNRTRVFDDNFLADTRGEDAAQRVFNV